MFREPGHSASSMTSFAAGLPNLPSCRSIELPIPPGRKCWPSQGRDAFTCEAAASSMTFLPPGCRAVVSAGPPMLAKSGCGCFRELGHRILHDFLAAVLPNLPSCRSIELPIPPGRKCWPSQGADVSRAGPQRIFHDFLCRRAAQPAELSIYRAANSAGPQMLAKSGRGCFESRATAHLP